MRALPLLLAACHAPSADTGADTGPDTAEDPAVLAVAVGENGAIWERRDAGWVAVDPPVDRCIDPDACTPDEMLATTRLLGLNSVALLGPREALAVAGSGLILHRRADGSWERIDDAASPVLSAVAADPAGAAGGVAVGVGPDGGAWSWDGADWTPTDSPVEGAEIDGVAVALRDVALAGDAGVAVGGTFDDAEGEPEGVLLELRDGAWTLARDRQDRTLLAAGMAEGLALAGGFSLSGVDPAPNLLREVAGGDWEPTGEALPWRQDVTGIDVVDGETALAVTDGGALAKTASGGLLARYEAGAWTVLALGGELPASWPDAPGALDAACALADGGIVLAGDQRLVEGDGATWVAVDLPALLPDLGEDAAYELGYLRDVACWRG